MFGGAFSSAFVFAVDVKIAKSSAYFKNKGPLPQVLAAFLFTTPLFIFNYLMVNQRYQELKKHLVFKYLN
jgi:hypothetical protein